MKCLSVQKQLDCWVIANDVTDCVTQNVTIQRHLESCDLCRHYWSDLQLAQKLQSLQVPSTDEQFTDRLIARAIRGDQSVVSGNKYLLALAAMLVLGVGLGLSISTLLPGTSPLPTEKDAVLPLSSTTQFVELAVNKIEPVNIIINSDADVVDSNIHIVLADNMEIDGYPDTRELNWNATLRKGKNLIKLPLKIYTTERGFLQVAYSDGLTEHSLYVDVDGYSDVEGYPDV